MGMVGYGTPCIYASLCTIVGVHTPYTLPGTVTLSHITLYVHRLGGRMCTFNTEVERKKPLGAERCPFSLRINPLPARKGTRKSKETRYRESLRTRRGRISQPF